MISSPDLEYERGLVGAVLLDPGLLSLVHTSPLEFSDFRARACWGAIRMLEEKQRPIDAITVYDAAVAAGASGLDVSYLAACATNPGHRLNAVEYSRKIRDAHLMRTIQLALTELPIMAKRQGWSGADLLTEVLAAVAKLDADQPDAAQTIGQLARARMVELGLLYEQSATASGFPTGVQYLDEKIGGWQPGIVTIVAARPGMGKSSLGMSTADACSTAGVGVHVFSLEDTRTAYTDRALSRISGRSSESIRNLDRSHDHLGRLTSAAGRLGLRNGWLADDRSGISASEVVRSVRRHKRANGTRVVIVDYVQLLASPRWAGTSSHERLTASVQILADAAKQDGLAYVVMSQLNRGVEQRADKRPQLSDLRESGSLEERAKCVVGIYRGAAYGPPTEGIDYRDGQTRPTDDEWQARAELVVLKNSNGRTGIVNAHWHGETTRLS